jgi:hypothetical protein
MRCCMSDGGWPSAVALQGEAANHRKVLRSKAVVLSVAGKGAPSARQVGAGKANESDPLMTCRKEQDDIKTGLGRLARDQPGGCLSIGQVVSGMKVARARLRRLCGTWEPALRYRDWPVAQAVACSWSRERDVQAAESVRARVASRSAGADRLVVVMTPGNAGRATGAGHPGLFGGQPPSGGRSR